MRVALALVLVLDALLAWAVFRPTTTPVVYPLAPPLTRISALGDHPIGGDGPPPHASWRLALEATLQAVGTPAQQAELAALRPTPPAPSPGRALIQADAVAIARVLGPERVRLILANKETLGATYGEGRIWDQIAR